ncbi:hypothetical protein STIAU_5435, partial [Stigmatella aurantiaca DW4/3-1]
MRNRMAEPEPSPAGPSPLDAFTRRLRLSSDLWGRRVTLLL